MKHKWIISDQKLFNMPCLIHTKTNELCVFSPQGELWAYDDSTVSVLINSGHRKALRECANLMGVAMPKLAEGEQYVFKIPVSKLFDLKKVFLIKKDITKQMLMANK